MAHVLARYRTLPRNVRLYLMASLLRAFNFQVAAIAMNLYLHAAGLGAPMIGMLNGLPAIANLIFGAPFGRLGDRYGFRRLFLFGAVVAPLAAIGIAWSTAPALLVALAFVQGIGSTTGWVMATPFLSLETPRERLVEVLSLNSALMGVVGVAGSLIAGVLPTLAGHLLGLRPESVVPLRWTYSVGGLVALSSLPFLYAIREVRPAKAQVRRPAGETGPRRANLGLMARLLLVDALIALGAGMMVPFFQLFFYLRFRFSTASIGLVFALGAVISSAATMIAPRLTRRFGTIRTTIWTQLGSLPFLGFLAWVGSAPLAVASYWLRGSLMNMASPAYAAFEMEMVPAEQRGFLSGLQAVFGGMGRGGIGPLVSGYLQERGGFGPAFSLTLAFYALSSALAWWFFGRRARRPAPSES